MVQNKNAKWQIYHFSHDIESIQGWEDEYQVMWKALDSLLDEYRQKKTPCCIDIGGSSELILTSLSPDDFITKCRNEINKALAEIQLSEATCPLRFKCFISPVITHKNWLLLNNAQEKLLGVWKKIVRQSQV